VDTKKAGKRKRIYTRAVMMVSGRVDDEEEEVYRKKESRMTRLSLIAVGRAIHVFQFSGGRRPQAISSTTPPPSRRTSVCVCVYV